MTAFGPRVPWTRQPPGSAPFARSILGHPVLVSWSAARDLSTYAAKSYGPGFIALKRTASTAEKLASFPVGYLTDAAGYTVVAVLSHPTASQTGSAMLAWPQGYSSAQVRLDMSTSASNFQCSAIATTIGSSTITDSSANVFDPRHVVAAVSVNGTSINKLWLSKSAGGYTENSPALTLGASPGAGEIWTNPFGETGDQARILAFVLLRGEITGSKFASLIGNPWAHLFSPVEKRIWVPSAAAPTGFKAAWAVNANTVIQGGQHAA